MADADLLAQWRRDETAPFAGWNFAYIADRYSEGAPHWDYLAIARALIAGNSSVLDMETGGGEVFASLAPFPSRAFAIEAYHPNVAVAARRLRPLGVEVFEAHATGPLPFADETFDLVLNRHGAFSPSELARVLRPGGQFLTQQVAGDNLADLMTHFDTKPQWPDHTVANATLNIAAAGLKTLRIEQWHGVTHFKDVGALIYFLKASPFVVPDFSVDRYLPALELLQSALVRGRPLNFISSRFLIHAARPGIGA